MARVRSRELTKGQILNGIRIHTERIAVERDHLRELHAALADVLESTDEGLREIEAGVDRLSEFL